MPADVAMCDHQTCDLRTRCQRHKASGAVAQPLQWYAEYAPADDGMCVGFLEKEDSRDE